MQKRDEQPIALAFSDLEIANYTSYSQGDSRLKRCLQVLAILSDKSVELGKLPVLFCGDLFDNPKVMDNYVLACTLETLQTYYKKRNIRLIGIAGNHDQSQKNTSDNPSPNWLRSLYVSGYVDYIGDSFTLLINPRVKVYGIDYMTEGEGFKSKLIRNYKDAKLSKYPTILMIHTDLPGALDPSGREVKEWTNSLPQKWQKYFGAFTWVLSGHIHKPMQVWDNTYMLGAPLHKRTSDEGCEMGYWEIYVNQKPKFKSLNLPKFITLAHGKTPPDNFNYYLTPEENKPESGDTKEDVRFSTSLSKVKLAKRYLKAKGIKSAGKKRTLIKILNETEK